MSTPATPAPSTRGGSTPGTASARGRGRAAAVVAGRRRVEPRVRKPSAPTEPAPSGLAALRRSRSTQQGQALGQQQPGQKVPNLINLNDVKKGPDGEVDFEALFAAMGMGSVKTVGKDGTLEDTAPSPELLRQIAGATVAENNRPASPGLDVEAHESEKEGLDDETPPWASAGATEDDEVAEDKPSDAADSKITTLLDETLAAPTPAELAPSPADSEYAPPIPPAVVPDEPVPDPDFPISAEEVAAQPTVHELLDVDEPVPVAAAAPAPVEEPTEEDVQEAKDEVVRQIEEEVEVVEPVVTAEEIKETKEEVLAELEATVPVEPAEDEQPAPPQTASELAAEIADPAAQIEAKFDTPLPPALQVERPESVEELAKEVEEKAVLEEEEEKAAVPAPVEVGSTDEGVAAPSKEEEAFVRGIPVQEDEAELADTEEQDAFVQMVKESEKRAKESVPALLVDGATPPPQDTSNGDAPLPAQEAEGSKDVTESHYEPLYLDSSAADQGTTYRPRSLSHSSSEGSDNNERPAAVVEPPSLTLAVVNAWKNTTWSQRIPAILASVAINFGLPFINGVMLGFGELFAREFLGFRLGWGLPGRDARAQAAASSGRANTASVGLRGAGSGAAGRTFGDAVRTEAEVLIGDAAEAVVRS